MIFFFFFFIFFFSARFSSWGLLKKVLVLRGIGCSKGTNWLLAVWIGKTLLRTETGWSREKIGGLLWYGCRDKHRRCDYRLDHNSSLTRCSHSSSFHCHTSLQLLWQTCNHAAPTNQHVSLLKKQGTPTTTSSTSSCSSSCCCLPASLSLCAVLQEEKTHDQSILRSRHYKTQSPWWMHDWFVIFFFFFFFFQLICVKLSEVLWFLKT